MPVADAHGLQREGPSATFQFVQHGNHDAGTARAQRMTDRNGPTIGIDFVQVYLEFFLPGQDHGSKSLIDFKKIDIGDFQPGAFQRQLGSRDRAGQRKLRVRAYDNARLDLGARFQPVSESRLFRGDQERCGRIADLAGIAGGNLAVFLEWGFQAGEFFHRCIPPRTLVRRKHELRPVFFRHFDRETFFLQFPFVESLDRPLMTQHAEFIQIFPAQAPLIGDQLRRNPRKGDLVLVRHHGRPRSRPLGPHREPGHAFDAAGDDEIRVSGDDGLRRVMDRLLT